MSENENGKKEPKIRVTIDRTPEIESMQEEIQKLKSERNVSLLAQAQGTLKRECKALGLNYEEFCEKYKSPQEISTALEVAKGMREKEEQKRKAEREGDLPPAPTGGNTADYDSNVRGGNPSYYSLGGEDLSPREIEQLTEEAMFDASFGSHQEMIDYLEDKASKGSVKAKKILTQLASKTLTKESGNWEYEFQGKGKDFLVPQRDKDPRSGVFIETEEHFAQRVAEHKKRIADWKKVR